METSTRVRVHDMCSPEKVPQRIKGLSFVFSAHPKVMHLQVLLNVEQDRATSPNPDVVRLPDVGADSGTQVVRKDRFRLVAHSTWCAGLL